MRGRSTFSRRPTRRLPLFWERLEPRQLLSADGVIAPDFSSSAWYADAVPEGESSLPKLQIQALGSLSVSTGTGYKAQSKVWNHDGRWWAAVANSGTRIFRLDGTTWTPVLTLTSTAYRTDVKSEGNLVHVLLFPDGPATKLVSAEYVPATKTYQLWSQRPQVVDVPLRSGVRLATLDLDSTGRMWIAADSTSTIDMYYSEPSTHYATWHGPVTIGTGVIDGDISVVTTLRNGSIGVLWSNQTNDRFHFRVHRDRDSHGNPNDPASWEPVELAAAEAALNVGGGMADDHLNVAVAADGTLYAGVKTSYDRSGYTRIGAIVRRPNGVWDPKLYHVSNSGTRPIIVLNDALNHLMVIYDNVYHESSTETIAFSAAKSLPTGSNVTSTKQNWVNDLVVLGGGKAVLIKTDAIANRSPVALNDEYSAIEDQPRSVTAANGVLKNDTDAEGNLLKAILVTGPAHGSLTLQDDGSFLYTPHSHYFGPDQFTYQANDGFSTSNVGTVSIAVAAVNDPPTAQPDRYSVEENQLLTVPIANGILKNDDDVDGDTLTATLVDDVANGQLTLQSDGSFTYQPDTDYSGTDSFTYRASDGVVSSGIVTVTIVVNAKPVAANDAYSVDEDQSLVVTAPGVLGNDSDADAQPLTAKLVTGPSHGVLDLASTGRFTYQPAKDYVGIDRFTYVATDGIDDSAPATVTIDVKPVADPPQAVADDYTAETDQPLVVPASRGVLANDRDVDGDVLTAALVAPPTHGTVILEFDGSFTYKPNPGYEGKDAFSYENHDGTSSSNQATVSITVINSTAPITVHLQDGLNGYSGTRDTYLRGDQTTQNYGKSTRVELDGHPDYVGLVRWDTSAISPSSTVLSVALTVNVVNTSIHDYEIYEAVRSWDELTATFTNAETGKPWGLAGAAGSSDRGSDVLATLASTKTGLVTIPLGPKGVEVVQKWISDPAANRGLVLQDLANTSSDDLDISSREHSGLGPKLSITYRPTPPPPPNDPPVAVADSYLADEDRPLVLSAAEGVLANDSDLEGDALRAALETGPANGLLTLHSDGGLRYEPNRNFFGTDTFVYRAIDSFGKASQPATVTMTVRGENDPPVAQDLTATTSKDKSVAFTLPATDADGDSLTYVLVTSPTSGSLSGTSPQLTYTPAAGFVGTDSFTFRVEDATTASNTATVTIQVKPFGEPEWRSFQDGVSPAATYFGTTDAAIRGDQPTSNHGTRDSLWLDGNPDQASFLRWDLSSIPAGSQVHAVTITIAVINTSIDTFPIYEMRTPWDEKSVTFQRRNATTDWQVAGAQGDQDRGSAVLGTLTAPQRTSVVISLNAAGLQAVQRWIDQPTQNHGIVLQNYDNISTDDLDFTSREGSTPTTRPKLSIQISVPFSSGSVSGGPTVAALKLAPPSLQNRDNPHDVDRNGQVTPGDVLVLVNALNRSSEGEGTWGGEGIFPDVSGDGRLTPLDALLVVNYLNERVLLIPEGESAERGPSISPESRQPKQERPQPAAWSSAATEDEADSTTKGRARAAWWALADEAAWEPLATEALITGLPRL